MKGWTGIVCLLLSLATFTLVSHSLEREAAPTPQKQRIVSPCVMDTQLEPSYHIEIPQELFVPELDEQEVILLSKLVYGEARGCTKTEQAAVVWCVLNRVDSDVFPDTIAEVVLQKNQFHGYKEKFPVNEEIAELVRDVLTRWKTEGQEGRVLPEEYVYFHGDGKHNHFRKNYKNDRDYWDWRLESPYV